MRVVSRLAAAVLAMVVIAGEAWAAPTCPPPGKPPVGRYLRQLYLDLLGRPPTLDEYSAAEAKGDIAREDIHALLASEEFYKRMRGYHHALFHANIVDSVYNNGDSALVGTGDVGATYEQTGNPAASWRGRNGQRSDNFIPQDDCGNALYAQDPHAEPATKKCYDANGVPLPVSYDYNPSFYSCTKVVDPTKPSVLAKDCLDALAKGWIPEKYLYFCDMQRDFAVKPAVLKPWLCLPDQAKADTKAMTKEIFDAANKHVVAFENPSPTSANLVTHLDRCGLDLTLNTSRRYVVQTGCIQREGYVMRAPPPWDTSGRTKVAVSAMQAQDRMVSPLTGLTCEGSNFMSDRSCGCGPNYRRCEPADRSLHNARVTAFDTEPELIADSVLRRDEPYFNVLSTRRSFVNGTLSALYHDDQAGLYFKATPPARPEAIPQVPFAEVDTWKEFTRDANHSGVLTTPAFLLRYPTQRARVAFFYDAFLCKTFAPPSDATMPAPDDSCNRENNLAKRCGCKYCHATIEPTGSHWGRYSERTATYLDPVSYPKFSTTCRDCALNGNCGGSCTDYVTAAYDGDGAASIGMLKSYLYRTSQEEQNIDAGPRLLVERMLRTGELERCAVHRIWKEFLGRPMSGEEERLYLEDLAHDFAADNHRMKGLIERILMTDAYRRLD